MSESVLNPKDTTKISNSEDFEFTGCDSFNPNFTSSSASIMWYKAGETMMLAED